MVDLDLDDIQGLILRGYAMPVARHFVLRINDGGAFRSFIRRLTGGQSASALQITTAATWAAKPAHCLNVGFTFEGLRAAGLSEASLSSFPEEFIEGSAARAAIVGDVRGSAPESWVGGLGTQDAHMILTLFAQGEAELEAATTELRSLFTAQEGHTELSHQDGSVFPANLSQPTRLLQHFGYSDGFSQPSIEGGPASRLPDPLPAAPAGEFLLGHPSQHRGFTYPVPSPNELGHNGSFAAFRKLEQDVEGFHQYLHDAASKVGMTEEKLAAKLCGRWRNGVPLVLSPETDSPDPPIPDDQYNNFDYVSSGEDPGDTRGYKCPIGSHIRRTQPRGQKVAGGAAHLRRLVRRGLPYGPPYDPGAPRDGIERGLLGMFICVSIRDQFEFIMKDWVNDGLFAGGLGRTKDPILGNNTPEESKFVIPVEGGPPVTIKGFPQFVTTRGSAYCFLPSITALEHLSRLD